MIKTSRWTWQMYAICIKSLHTQFWLLHMSSGEEKLKPSWCDLQSETNVSHWAMNWQGYLVGNCRGPRAWQQQIFWTTNGRWISSIGRGYYWSHADIWWCYIKKLSYWTAFWRLGGCKWSCWQMWREENPEAVKAKNLGEWHTDY